MWPFGKKKNKQEENDNPTQERSEELPKEPIKAPVTEIKKSTSSSAFCMGVEGKFLLGKELLYAGTIKGTVNVGDEICIVNPGDYEISFDDVITFDTPNVVKAKIAKIEVGSEKSSVESVTDSKASIVFDEDMEYYIRTGTVFCSSGSKGDIIRPRNPQTDRLVFAVGGRISVCVSGAVAVGGGAVWLGRRMANAV